MMVKRVTVDQALEKLEKETPLIPPIEMPPQDPHTQLQAQVMGISVCLEAVIDILFAFDLMNEEILRIAQHNVNEFNQLTGNTQEILPLRATTLKKLLAEYSKSKRQDKIKTGGKKKHG